MGKSLFEMCEVTKNIDPLEKSSCTAYIKKN